MFTVDSFLREVYIIDLVVPFEQKLYSISSPGQVLPVVRGRGAVHNLCLCCLVPPQTAVHSDQDDQSLHPPYTGKLTHTHI